MPIFNVIHVDQTHIAKVLAVKRNSEVTETVPENTSVEFMRWQNYIRKQLKETKGLLSSRVVHIFNRKDYALHNN